MVMANRTSPFWKRLVKLISVLLSVGDGTFLPRVDYPELGSSDGTTPLTSGDVNGDGKLDLITVGSVLLGNGDGTFQSPLAYSGTPRCPGGAGGGREWRRQAGCGHGEP